MVRRLWLLSVIGIAITLSALCSASQRPGGRQVWLTDKTCPAAKEAAREIGRVPFPPGWSVVVACNDMQWELLQRRADAQGTFSAFTNVKGRITVIRGGVFLRETALRPAHRVLLHEIGHIQCNCDDEGRAEQWAVEYERRDMLGSK